MKGKKHEEARRRQAQPDQPRLWAKIRHALGGKARQSCSDENADITDPNTLTDGRTAREVVTNIRDRYREIRSEAEEFAARRGPNVSRLAWERAREEHMSVLNDLDMLKVLAAERDMLRETGHLEKDNILEEHIDQALRDAIQSWSGNDSGRTRGRK